MLLGLAMIGSAADLLPNERQWADLEGDRAKGQGGGGTFRKWMEATVLPEFVFEGSLGDAIARLMNVSRQYSPDGRAAGGFILRSGVEPKASQVDVRLGRKNALEIVDELCRQSGVVWCLAPYAVILAPKPDE